MSSSHVKNSMSSPAASSRGNTDKSGDNAVDEDFPELPDFSAYVEEAPMEAPPQHTASYSSPATSVPGQNEDNHNHEAASDDSDQGNKGHASPANRERGFHPTQAQLEEWESLRKIIEVPSEETFELAQENRYILKQGELMKKGMESRLKRTNKRYAVLCSDAFLLLKKESSKKYVLKNAVSVATCVLRDLQWGRAFPDKVGEYPEYSFQLMSPQKSFTLIASSQQEKVEWMEQIRLAIESQLPEEIAAGTGWRHQIFQGTWYAAAITGSSEVAEGLVQFVPYYRKHFLEDEEDSESKSKQKPPEASEDVLESFLYDVNRVDDDGFSPLMLASSKGTTDVASLLLKGGARLGDTDFNGNTALHLACQNGHDEIISMLVTNGASLDKKNFCGETPLHSLLAMNANTAVNTFPCEQLQRIHAPDETSMTHIELCFEALLMSGRTPDCCARNAQGEAPLHVVSMNPHLSSLIPWLVRHGALANDPFGDQQASPLHLTCGFDTQSGAKTIERVLDPPISNDTAILLLKFGGSPNQRTKGAKETPLHVILRTIINWNMSRKQVEKQDGKDSESPAPNPDVEQNLIKVALNLCAFGARLDLKDKNGVDGEQLIEKVDSVRGKSIRSHLQKATKDYLNAKAPRHACFERDQVPGMEASFLGPQSSQSRELKQQRKGTHISLLVRKPSNFLQEAGVFKKRVPDDAAEACYICSSSFKALTRRKHHCRSCFALICDLCSQKRFPIKCPSETGEYAFEPSRVCDACFNRLRTDADDTRKAAVIRKEQKSQVLENAETEAGASEPVGQGASAGAMSTSASAVSRDTQSPTERRQYQNSEVQQQVEKSRQKMMERGEKINELQDKTADMAKKAESFNDMAAQLAESQKKRSSMFGGFFWLKLCHM
eukprot:gb/GECG01015266.1/.p1 GENE.gb/GECG01015266.1/~~gb/GECG01015266.1/.p1  ORF type:complete len:893 (+),score=137.91 gb/GECG01015266.1/:1-2679(+)